MYNCTWYNATAVGKKKKNTLRFLYQKNFTKKNKELRDSCAHALILNCNAMAG